ncbi:ABC transporter ATP-binding protein [Nonomuraea sp. NPDC046802]|uniref:ABC transporter ATP-binding protein n=1 Tax=Nonomuraea sp. NPDC046802 TaxID=3154919 RepID=UPI0033E3E73F
MDQDSAAMTAPANTGGRLELRKVSKHYGNQLVVDDVDITIADGEFLTLLGPSGCGKTTVLNLLAGFIGPDAGDILIDGVSMAATPPHRRPVNTVFQDYALFPHMSVLDNVAFGLRMAKMDRKNRRARAGESLELVGMSGFGDRRPAALSGGQRQRVALARALVCRPRALLLDEPFAALDLQLRRQLQRELRALHTERGTTFVFVTHDQEEAATLSDRIAVLRGGRVEQAGTPGDIFDRPQTAFVAGFIGESNVLPAVTEGAGLVVPGLGGVTIPVPADRLPAKGVAIRPERLRVLGASEETPQGWYGVAARTLDVIRVASDIRITAETEAGATLRITMPVTEPAPGENENVRLAFHLEHAVPLPSI